jgi:tryptophan synthase alpha chain
MSRIAAAFERLRQEGRKALIPFFTAGDPSREATVPVMRALVAAGADVIELGVPFSDPMADGPTIQRSSERALKHHTSLTHVIGMVREFRSFDDKTPVVLMGYANPIEAMGVDAFAEAAATGGVDGVLVVDYPPEEAQELAAALALRAVDIIFLVAPTTTETRMREIGRLARGYLYYVSLRGVTGAANMDLADVRDKLALLRKYVKVPIGVGFGIRDGEAARRVAEFADAVVIGSRLVQEMEESTPQTVAERVGAVLHDVRVAMDRPTPAGAAR